jgi:predicted DNA-binding WGR domain protein
MEKSIIFLTSTPQNYDLKAWAASLQKDNLYVVDPKQSYFISQLQALSGADLIFLPEGVSLAGSKLTVQVVPKEYGEHRAWVLNAVPVVSSPPKQNIEVAPTPMPAFLQPETQSQRWATQYALAPAPIVETKQEILDIQPGKKMRFEVASSCKAGSKFWQIEVQGNEMTTSWGAKGAKGQSKTKSFANAEAALKEARKIIAKKQKEGYC